MVVWTTVSTCLPCSVDRIRVTGREAAWKAVHKAATQTGYLLRSVAPEAASRQLCAGTDLRSWCCSVVLYILPVPRTTSLSSPRSPAFSGVINCTSRRCFTDQSETGGILIRKEFLQCGYLYSILSIEQPLGPNSFVEIEYIIYQRSAQQMPGKAIR